MNGLLLLLLVAPLHALADPEPANTGAASTASIQDEPVEKPFPAAVAAQGMECPAKARAIKVYDGDTITLDGGQRVRLLWVNTPELRPMEAYAEEARDAAFAFVAGKDLIIECSSNRIDKYGRLVASVKVGETYLAEHLLDLGLGHVMLLPPFEGELDFLFAAQRRAREARRGIWKDKRYQGRMHITSFHANAPGDDRVNLHGEYSRVVNISDEPVSLEGWRVQDLSKHSFDLPPIVVPPGYSVEIRSGQGEHQGDPTQQLVVYLGNTKPLWSNKRDMLTLYNPQGKVEDERLHAPKSAR
jgi:endonuclease YncB( thermonuclease family)